MPRRQTGFTGVTDCSLPVAATMATMSTESTDLLPDSDPYAAIADLYDIEHADYDEDLELYRQLSEVIGDPILELGCGSGRILEPLAADGHRVTGLDRSPVMLERARQLVDRAGTAATVTLHEGDMTDAKDAPGGPFGLVIISLNGLLHLPRLADQREALTSARRALDPRGQLVLDVLHPTPEALRALDRGFGHEGTWQLADAVRLDKFAARRVLPAEQQIVTDLWYDRTSRDGAVHRTATSFTMRYLHRAEIELLLELAGFVEWHVYGSYDLDPISDGADRLIFTAEVTPGDTPSVGLDPR